MEWFGFFRHAGEKLFSYEEIAQLSDMAQRGDAEANSRAQALNKMAADAIVVFIRSQKLDAESLFVTFDGTTATARVFGKAPNQSTREKIFLCCGNVAGVAKVEDGMTTASSEPEAGYCEVFRGDTLSKIAQEQYGSPSKFPLIFEANMPMLKHPDKIYPGQVLRIPSI